MTSVSVKPRHSVFDAQYFGQTAQKSDAKDFPVDAQFHMAVRHSPVFAVVLSNTHDTVPNILIF